MTDNTLDINAAGKLMNIHPKTVLDMINRGVLPAGRVGRAYVMLKRDVMAHIEKVIVQQTAQRMGTPQRRSPKRPRQVAAAQVGIPAKHLQRPVAGYP